MPGHDDRDTRVDRQPETATMRKRLRDNSLSLVMFSLFGLCLLGHSLACYARLHDHMLTRPLRYTAYVTSTILGVVPGNWESEFLQMAAYVPARVFCFQRGSAESKIGSHEEWTRTRASINTSRRPQAGAKRARAHTLCPFPLHGACHSVRSVLARPCGEWRRPLPREQRVHGQALRVHAPVLGTHTFGLSRSGIGRVNF